MSWIVCNRDCLILCTDNRWRAFAPVESFKAYRRKHYAVKRATLECGDVILIPCDGIAECGSSVIQNGTRTSVASLVLQAVTRQNDSARKIEP